MEEKYKSILDTCKNIATEFDLVELLNSLNMAECTLEKGDKDIIFIENTGRANGLIQIAEHICGKLPLELVDQFRKYDNTTLTLCYGETDEWYLKDDSPFDGEQIAERYVLQTKTELLRNVSIKLTRTNDMLYACTQRIASACKIYLLMNATMPMTMEQKDWIENFICQHYDTQRFSICLIGNEHIVSTDDQKKVLSYVKDKMKHYGTPSILSDREILEYLEKDSKNVNSLVDSAKKTTIKNIIDEMVEKFNCMKNANQVEESEITHIREELEKHMGRLLVEAKLSADNVVDNEIYAIKDILAKDAEKHRMEMCECIKNNIIRAENLDNIETTIEIYMRDEWNDFAKESTAKIKNQFEILTRKLQERMCDDFENALAKLDEKSHKTLDIILPSRTYYMPKIPYVSVDRTNSQKIHKQTLLAIMAAVPLTFLSPVLSTTAITGGLAYQYLKEKKELTKYREQLLKHVERMFEESQHIVEDSMNTGLDIEKTRIRELIMRSYESGVAKLSDVLNINTEALKTHKNQRKRIEEILTIVLPQMLNAVEGGVDTNA